MPILKNEGEKLMKKLLFVLLSSVLMLTACGGQPRYSTTHHYHTVNTHTSKDTVLWINADGTDCDLGDLEEGDRDCYKTKKTTYYSTPRASLLSKLKHKKTTVTTTTTTVTKKVSLAKKKVAPKINIVKKKTVTWKRSKPSYKISTHTRTTRTTTHYRSRSRR
jgi:hypothetical protein